MLDFKDATFDSLRLAVARALARYFDDEIRECAKDPSPIIRTAAAREMHIRGGRENFDFAVLLCGHDRFEMREVGAFILGQLGTPGCPFANESFGILEALLGDKYFEVQGAAVRSLGSLASLGHYPPDYINPTIFELSDSQYAYVRAAVAYRLGMIRSDDADKFLEVLVLDGDKNVLDTAEFSMQLRAERGAQK